MVTRSAIGHRPIASVDAWRRSSAGRRRPRNAMLARHTWLAWRRKCINAIWSGLARLRRPQPVLRLPRLKVLRGPRPVVRPVARPALRRAGPVNLPIAAQAP